MNTPQRRVLVLGASNVVRSLALVIETACHSWGRPLDIMAAVGHGRSYGMTSTVLGRTLPSILDCDLWEEWKARPHLPTAALLTDIGNDIFYEVPPEQIAQWVRRCLERIAPHGDRIAITELPLERGTRLGPRQFKLMRSLFFPRCRLALEQVVERGKELNTLVLNLAKEFGAAVVKPETAWYGLDPIHIRPRRQPEAWRAILGPWRTEAECPTCNPSFRDALRWWLARPKQRRLFGREQCCEQPVGYLTDGTSVSLY